MILPTCHQNHIMKSIWLFLLVFFTCVQSLLGQLTGSVQDKEENEIPYANITLLSSPEAILQTGTMTDENGRFELDFPDSGTYIFRVSLLAFKTWESEPFTITSNPQQLSFPPITLLEEVTSLEGVAVVGKRKLIQRTQEGSIINVQESILTKGSSALQLLERSPGVLLDQRNNSFSLNGKSGTLIMINGKPQRIPTADLIAMLSGMSADNIEKIELLTNPSARYDVDGTAGIINIVLSKNETLGLRGSISLSAGYGEGPKQTTGFTLNYGSERSNLFGSYTFSYDDFFHGWIANGVTDLPVLGGNTEIVFQSDMYQINRSHNFNVGYEYKLSETSLIGTNLVYNQSSPLTSTRNRGLYDFTIDPFLEAQIRLDGDGMWENLNASMYFETKKEKNTFVVTADYINYNNQSPNRVNSSYFDEDGVQFQPESEIYNEGNRGFSETNINLGVLKLDYKHILSKDASMEFGLKTSLSKTVNDAKIEILEGDTFISDERFINNIENEEKIGAVYSLADFHLNKKLKAQLGLRYEYWDQNFDDSSLNRSFGKLFPSIFITHALSDTTALSLAYTKRITRPNYSDLASSLTYNGPTSVFSGNPQLLPAITDNITLTYNNKSFSVSVLASKEENQIARFQVTRNEASTIAVIAPVNLQYQRSLDIQANIPINISNWWNINLNGTAGIRSFKLLHTDEKLKHNYAHYNFNGNQTFLLPKNLSLELSGWYTSQHFNASIRVEGFGSLNAGIKKEFKNGSSLQFSVTDIFESIDIESRIGTLTREAFGDEFLVNYSPESGFSRIYRISFSYPFGNKKVKGTNTRSGADVEKSRI